MCFSPTANPGRLDGCGYKEMLESSLSGCESTRWLAGVSFLRVVSGAGAGTPPPAPLRWPFIAQGLTSYRPWMASGESPFGWQILQVARFKVSAGIFK